MALQRRKFPREFKLPVVREVGAGKPVAQAAREDDAAALPAVRWTGRPNVAVAHRTKSGQEKPLDSSSCGNLLSLTAITLTVHH
ncbi:MAG TPA: hypothetical protein VNN62_23685 [Methylomirabilota bacterium]|nr:hypothetical protein [Methylomirabilota bacterium]